MVLACYFRLFISVGFLGAMDEMHWVSSAANSSIGGTPFVTDRYIQQLCGLTYEPLVALYYKVFGNTGVLLFVRHLYFLLAAIVSVILYRHFRPKIDNGTSLAISSFPFVATFWGQPSMGYNAIGGLCFVGGAILIIEGVVRSRLRQIVFGSLFFAWALCAYPTLLGAVILFWFTLMASRIVVKKAIWKQALVSNGITGSVGLIFLLSLLWRAGWDQLAFSYQFSTAQSSLGHFGAKFVYGVKLMVQFLPPWYVLLSAFVVWFLAWRRWQTSWLLLAVPMSVIIALREPPEPGPYHSPLFVTLAFMGIPLVIQALRRDYETRLPEAVLWFTGLAGAVFPWWSSALTLYVAFITLNWSIVALLSLSYKKGQSQWISLLAFIIPLSIFYQKVLLNQTDDGVHIFDQELLTDGPYAGIWTSTQRRQYFDQLLADLRAVSAKGQSILYYDEFPLGYLMTDLKPATPALFMHGLRESHAVRPFFRAYYSREENRPDIIVRFNYFTQYGKAYSVDPSQYLPYKDVFWDYLPTESGAYTQVLNRDSYSIFIKKSRL
ncbi:MAG: hypothetical protein AB7F86_14995 [Bdellovibrionales bacterium]